MMTINARLKFRKCISSTMPTNETTKYHFILNLSCPCLKNKVMLSWMQIYGNKNGRHLPDFTAVFDTLIGWTIWIHGEWLVFTVKDWKSIFIGWPWHMNRFIYEQGALNRSLVSWPFSTIKSNYFQTLGMWATSCWKASVHHQASVK